MFNEKIFAEQLLLIDVPTDMAQVRLDPVSYKLYTDVRYPSMYLLNGPPGSYFYSTTDMCTLSIDTSEDLTHMFSWWMGDSNRYVISIVDMSDFTTDRDDTVPINDKIKWGTFHSTEEMHFQDDCLKGTPLTWEMEVLIRDKLNELIRFYEDVALVAYKEDKE